VGASGSAYRIGCVSVCKVGVLWLNVSTGRVIFRCEIYHRGQSLRRRIRSVHEKRPPAGWDVAFGKLAVATPRSAIQAVAELRLTCGERSS